MKSIELLLCFCVILSYGIDSLSSPVFEYDKAQLNAEYWYTLAKNSLQKAQNIKINNRKAKNVIIFLGDGMGVSTVTAARILKGQLSGRAGEDSILAFEEFPYVSMIKTYNVDRQVSDSAGTATAFLCGVKTNFKTLGVNANVKFEETHCDAVLNNTVNSIIQWAIDADKSAGIVTNTRITHATPSGAYAHIASRYWEGSMPAEVDNRCKDIARQLVENEPGSKLKVIMGGGRRNLMSKSHQDPYSGLPGYRTDGRNVIQEWIDHKNNSGFKEDAYAYVNSTRTLHNVNYNTIEYLMGLFNYNHMAYEKERDTSPDGEPSLEEMTESAIKILQKDKNGFVLLVEGGRIDHAHHDNFAGMALYETLQFEKAIEKALSMVSKNETLIVVTADHSHTLTINGYPIRGNHIQGVADENDTFGIPYTTLLYGNGPGFEHTPRPDPRENDTIDNLRYKQHSAVRLVESNHGGEDVVAYSTGPMSHLFHGVQEQSYIAHVMSFAACIGKYSNEPHCFSDEENTEVSTQKENTEVSTQKESTAFSTQIYTKLFIMSLAIIRFIS